MFSRAITLSMRAVGSRGCRSDPATQRHGAYVKGGSVG